MKLTIHFDSQNNMNPLSSRKQYSPELRSTKLQTAPGYERYHQHATKGPPNIFPLGKKDADENTRAFLQKVFEILLDFISKSNDRSAKILDFHQPNQLKEVLDLDIPDEPLNLDQLLVDCKDTLKYQVKTGM
ncbi:glutamate decarboxylase [Caerostris extrusa]|uniref:Glutamate decarboxylase n=1 Tax=Caerostris extrusa TaxID=172846 RepID=A0AAV4XCQ9_CAEEX|nr:glutamate decarboxylase [Caerostris extrusa]